MLTNNNNELIQHLNRHRKKNHKTFTREKEECIAENRCQKNTILSRSSKS